MTDEVRKMIDGLPTFTRMSEFREYVPKDKVVELVEKLCNLRKEEKPSESTTASNISNQLCEKYSLTIDYAPILEEAYELGQIRANSSKICKVNEELLDASISLYESLPDGYTHESVLKVKAILHPIYSERNHSRCNDIKNDEF